MKIKNFSFIFLFLKLRIIFSFSAEEFLRNPMLYINELCSYNGKPYYNSTTNEVTCKCNDKYTDEPRKDKIKYINGHIIHCSYQRKSRFFTIFLCLCFPFGIDFIYLKRYTIFILVIFISLCYIACGVITLCLNKKVDIKSKETIIQNKLNKMLNKVKNPKITEENNCRKIFLCLFITLLINHIIFIIIVVSLHITGTITDSEEVETENDLGYLFSTPD